MRSKLKNSFVLIALAFLFIALIGIISISTTKTTASADTTNRYKISFDYEFYTGTSSSSATVINASGTNVTVTDSIQLKESLYCETEFYLYGSNFTSIEETFLSGSYIGSNTINIETNSFTDSHEYTITDVSGATVAKGDEKNMQATLSDGSYTVKYVGKSDWVIKTNIRNHPRGIRLEVTFKLNIDNTTPTISGAATSSTEFYTNNAFTVTAFDSGSGVAGIYWKAPNTDTYSFTDSSSKKIEKGSVNGLYSFYAVDRVGKQSQVYYVNFDDTAPTLICSGATFGGTTNGEFTVIAMDNNKTIELYYRRDKGNWFLSQSERYTVSSSAEAGIYYFYAIDGCNNRSEELWVEVGGDIVGEFVKSDSDNSVYFTWERDSWTATLDGGNYTKGSWIRSEGKHTVVLSAGVANAVYTHTIDHYYVESISEATCTRGGQIEYNCVQCGDSYKTVSEELGHYYVASTVAPTCTDGGYTTYTCTRCGDNYTDNYTPKLGHNLVSSVVASQCTENGYTLYSCSRCDYEYRSGNTPATGHNYKETTYPATCTEGSYTLHECSRCGDSYKDNISQPLGHNFVEEEKPPTCTESGKIVYHCQVCDYEKEESNGSYPTGHDYSSIIVKEATCTDDGIRDNICDLCGETTETRIAAHGHSYEITEIQTKDGKTARTYTCRECGDSYTQELGNQYEEVTSYVEYLFEQYSPYMIWVFLATAGVWSIAIGVAIILAHKNEEKEKAKKMLVNYLIGLVVIFAILVACPYLIRGIAVLVTS